MNDDSATEYPAVIFEAEGCDFSHYFPAEDGRERLEIYNGARSSGYTMNPADPLSWANSVSVDMNPEDDAITVAISTGDPRGAFTMTIRRIPDDAPTNAGALVMSVPYPEDSTPHESLHQIRPGAYMVGGKA